MGYQVTLPFGDSLELSNILDINKHSVALLFSSWFEVSCIVLGCVDYLAVSLSLFKEVVEGVYGVDKELSAGINPVACHTKH